VNTSRKLLLTALFFLVLLACKTTTTGYPGRPSSPAAQPTPTAEELPTQVAVLLKEPSPVALTPASPPPTDLPTLTATHPPTATPLPTAAPTTEPRPLRLAVIGDYGGGGSPERRVSELVKSWNPDYVITLGDNNYPSGAAETIDHNIGQFYSEYIFPYTGQYGPGGQVNRFFPSLGNHDWDTNAAQPYLDYFSLPGNERYYEVLLDPVHLFVLDSDSREPDGVSTKSVQAAWLQASLAASHAPWKLVAFHHAPYSSGLHGPVKWMRWPFQEWGASAVLTGHDHTYERILRDSFPYFVNGLGGGARYYFVDIDPGSQARYNDDYGAMLITAGSRQITYQFYTHQGDLVDEYQVIR
jgi:hypothetical protein